MTELPAPAHVEEMRIWLALGGGNSGIVGNQIHYYGFHRGANHVPAADYSRRRDPKGADGPYSGDGVFACAGDYHHGGRPVLRARHAVLLTRLMDGDSSLENVCEMITQPWADKPVYYWARWNGRRVLQRYTGRGHDTWSHISVWRSHAIAPPPLWTPAGSGQDGTVARTPEKVRIQAPAWPAGRKSIRVSRNSTTNPHILVRVWKARMRQRGWRIKVDGLYRPADAAIATEFQREKHLAVDGILGPKTFAAAWTAKVTR